MPFGIYRKRHRIFVSASHKIHTKNLTRDLFYADKILIVLIILKGCSDSTCHAIIHKKSPPNCFQKLFAIHFKFCGLSTPRFPGVQLQRHIFWRIDIHGFCLMTMSIFLFMFSPKELTSKVILELVQLLQCMLNVTQSICHHQRIGSFKRPSCRKWKTHLHPLYFWSGNTIPEFNQKWSIKSSNFFLTVHNLIAMHIKISTLLFYCGHPLFVVFPLALKALQYNFSLELSTFLKQATKIIQS